MLAFNASKVSKPLPWRNPKENNQEVLDRMIGAANSHNLFARLSTRILVEVYGKHALSDTTCRDWFRRFKNGNPILETNIVREAQKKFDDEESEAILDEDPCQMQKNLQNR